jgi:hypothetical protein
MRTIVGIFLIIVSFFGMIFFRRYDGSVIPYPILWYLAFIILGFFGVWLIYTATRKIERVVEQNINAEVEIFKSKSEKIELDFDKCEFKSGSFSHQVEDPNMRAVKFLAPGSLTSNIDTTITENVIQSYLTYTDIINGQPQKFISHSFPFDQTTLKFYVLKHNITLYVDRFNREKYLFDLKR